MTGTGGISGWAGRVVSSRAFQGTVLGSIIAGGLIVGLESIPSVSKVAGNALRAIDALVIAVFVVEAVLKIAAAERGWPLGTFGRPRDDREAAGIRVQLRCEQPRVPRAGP